MDNSILNRFQRLFVVPLIIILAGFVIGLSWWTIQLQLGILESDLNRRGMTTVETLAKSSQTSVVKGDREALQNLIDLIKEKEAEIISVAFLNLRGDKILSAGQDIHLPLDPDRLKFLKPPGEFHKRKYDNLYLSPVVDKQSTLAVAAIQMARDYLNKMHRRARIAFTVIVLAVIGFNTFIYHYLVREALRASQLQRAFDDLKKLQDQILQQEKMAAIGRLASGVGHELRNPLGAIKNAIYYIKDAIPASDLLQKDPMVGEFIEVIETEIKSSTAIISDLLDYSKVGKLHPQMTDVNGLLSEVKSVLEIPANVKVSESFGKGLPQVLADPIRLRQVFINLAVNAFQAMPEGGSLTISTELQNHSVDKEVWVAFKDSGAGIAEENMKKIFEPLFTTKDKGTGLGLAICSGIVEAHGGVIEVNSTVGKGSEFIVKLPMEAKSAFFSKIPTGKGV